MIRCHQVASSPIVVLFIFFCLTFEPTNASPVTEDTETLNNRYGPPSPAFTQTEIESTQAVDGQQVAPGEEEEEEDELFKDVDPKTLAAVLLEALNKPQGKVTSEENKKEGDEKAEEVRETQGAERDRDRQQELELVMAAAAAQGREEREREEDEERKRIEEEEERLTERVTSRTTSQTVPVKEPEAVTKEVVNKEGQQDLERGADGEMEEQLSPEELKNLETMLKEFQSYSTATKRERDSSTGQRESRGEYLDYLDRNGLMNNEIKPKAKGHDLALSKKKLKWQIEQEKNKNRPLYRGGNFMDDFNDNLEDQEEVNGEDEEDEEQLSPEEEEARAKAEQEEVRRQAAEAQRAKAEEEKLADIASDMLLQYMVKPDGKKIQDNNAAEDKRSEEDTSDDDDDIDPQTIDKLIEISSKLHLPADDVVDIISDVEKKKKKDAPENLQWQRPLVPLPAPVAPSTALRTTPLSKPPKPNTNPFKTWFKDRASVKPSKQDFWFKQQWPFRTYPSYGFYQKPYNPYYPIYIPPPKPKPRYYAKPSYSLNDILGNSLDNDFDFSLKQRYRPWAQPRPRAPPAFRRNLYFPNYIVPYPRTFQAIPMSKPRSNLHYWPKIFYPSPDSIDATEDKYYWRLGKQKEARDKELEELFKQIIFKGSQKFQ
ncbi:neurosecretory protein VGF [Hoplias malabaricus]|uniref:neurosecretory protein VGF n=1 Tax=Hoplias malabaricus TaxID=27720 RepID=UPI003462B1AF